MTTKYISISQYPGTTGQYYYNSFFKLHDIDAIYLPLAATPETFNSIIQEHIDGGVSGISISMPYKRTVISTLDIIDHTVSRYASCNTITINDGKLNGYNTDLYGVIESCKSICSEDTISILGDGSMGQMYLKYLHSIMPLSYRNNVRVYSRRLGNWDNRHDNSTVVINTTALGTVDSTSPLEYLSPNTRLVIDLAVKRGVLAEQSMLQGIRYYSGGEFYRSQFLQQYYHYTGINISELEFDRISKLR